MSTLCPMDAGWMAKALALAAKGRGATAPNPMVGAILVRDGLMIGQGWHHRAGLPHAEIEAIRDASRSGRPIQGATLYVTLEPCCTHGRTPPCTSAILEAGIRRVVVAATDPNPAHRGRGLRILRRGGVEVTSGVMAEESHRLNEAFEHWITHRTPWIVIKSAMTLDGKIATASGDSKWITGDLSRREGMRLRKAADAVLVGINTVLADNPSLTVRLGVRTQARCRIILDAFARTPPNSNVVSDEHAGRTLVVVGRKAPAERLRELGKRVEVIVAPESSGRVDLRWLVKELGRRGLTHVLIEGGGEVIGSFLDAGLAHRAVFFMAPIILGGRQSVPAVAGSGATSLDTTWRLRGLEWKRLGPDLMVTGLVQRSRSKRSKPM